MDMTSSRTKRPRRGAPVGGVAGMAEGYPCPNILDFPARRSSVAGYEVTPVAAVRTLVIPFTSTPRWAQTPRSPGTAAPTNQAGQTDERNSAHRPRPVRGDAAWR